MFTGPGSSASGAHTYNSRGLFTVSLAATKGSCRDTVTKKNYIYVEEPDAGFTASDTLFNCYPKTIDFVHDNSIKSPAVEFLWSFGNQTLVGRSSENVNYTFTKPGNYRAQLTVRTLNGCEATRSRNVHITGPDAKVSFLPRRLCYNEAVYFEMDSVRDASSWKWLFGDGSTSTSNPVTHRYTSRGKLVPSVQLINSSCTAIKVLDTISVSKVKAEFSSSDSLYNFCYGMKVNLLNRSLYSDSWIWDVDGARAGTGFDLKNVGFSNAGIHTVRLVAKEQKGCSDTLTKQFTVFPLPSFKIDGDSVICTGERNVILRVIQHSGDKIWWTPGDGLSNTTSFEIYASPQITTTYTARVTNSWGCSSSLKKKILVNEPFSFSRFPEGDTTIYLGEKIKLIIGTADRDVTYDWSPHESISCIRCNNPWVWPTQTTTYTVNVTNGCFNITEMFNIEVISDFYLEAPSAFTPNGDSNNDLFKFEGKNIASFNLRIFNRWGEIVFSTDDISLGWDGSVNGRPQNIDTYKYAVEAKTIHGYKFIKGGEFMLLR